LGQAWDGRIKDHARRQQTANTLLRGRHNRRNEGSSLFAVKRTRGGSPVFVKTRGNTGKGPGHEALISETACRRGIIESFPAAIILNPQKIVILWQIVQKPSDLRCGILGTRLR
jgi:hypothetical protein